MACQRAALADLINLRASDRLLHSQWSSWTEVLLSAAPGEMYHQSGCEPVGGAHEGGSSVAGLRQRPRSTAAVAGGGVDGSWHLPEAALGLGESPPRVAGTLTGTTTGTGTGTGDRYRSRYRSTACRSLSRLAFRGFQHSIPIPGRVPQIAVPQII